MEMIHDNEADLITLDGGDVYIAGRDYGMVPIMEEVYEEGDCMRLGSTSYLAGKVIRVISDVGNTPFCLFL